MGYLTDGLPEALQQFETDVFVSYSHGAFRGKSDTKLRQWSERLAEDLREEVQRSLRRDDLALFFDSSDRPDEGIDRALPLTDQLKTKVERAAVLAVLLSWSYQRSRWCAQERDWWLDRGRWDGLERKGRLLVAGVEPIAEEEWPQGPPAALKDLLPHLFYDKNQPTDMARPFAWGIAERTKPYQDALIKLTGTLARRLRVLRERLDRDHEEWKRQNRMQAAGGQALYLYARGEAEKAWDEACERLGDKKFVVYPDGPVPIAPNGGIDPEYRVQLQGSDGLLILASENGPALDSDMIVVGRTYRNLIVDQRSGLPLPCAVFDGVGVGPQDSRRLRNARGLGISWIDGTRPDWSDQIRDWLRGPA